MMHRNYNYNDVIKLHNYNKRYKLFVFLEGNKMTNSFKDMIAIFFSDVTHLSKA